MSRQPFRSYSGRKVHWCQVEVSVDWGRFGRSICDYPYWMLGYVADGPITCKRCLRSKAYRAWLEKAGLEPEEVEDE